jgi:DNA polymerase-1
MLVTLANFNEQIKRFSQPGKYGFDTETYGLGRKDKLFSIILADGRGAAYFDFNPLSDEPLPRKLLSKFAPVFGNRCSLFYIHNAKFDLIRLQQEAIPFLAAAHCTEVHAKLIRNDHITYSLDACLSRLGLKKDDAVKKYIMDNKLYEYHLIPGKKTRKRKPFYHLVPLEIMQPYGEMDAIGVRKLGEWQSQVICQSPTTIEINRMEMDLTKTCLEIENNGIRIDKGYMKRSIRDLTMKVNKIRNEFEELTGIEFNDGKKTLEAAFDKLGIKYPTTEKGNPSFNDKVLSELDNALTRIIKKYRTYHKLLNSYLVSFFYYEIDNKIHCNIRQSGATTGRFSITDPALQTLPKKQTAHDLVDIRRCFIPDPGTLFVSIDYDQVEYRVMVDMAGELDLIDSINNGLDVHTATAEMMGVSRTQAKTINFMIIYGGGVNKLASTLGIYKSEAVELMGKYKAKLPKINQFIKDKSKYTSTKTWSGRTLYVDDRNFKYKLPNYCIQGGCADIMKMAMNEIAILLRGRHTQMKLTIHDELLFQTVPSEIWLVKEAKYIMENIYKPVNGLGLTCSATYSTLSWSNQDQTEGLPL